MNELNLVSAKAVPNMARAARLEMHGSMMETEVLVDLAEWDQLPKRQQIPEKSLVSCPYLGGSKRQPRNIRTIRRWRAARSGPEYLKIGGRYFYEVGALRDFYQRCIRGRIV